MSSLIFCTDAEQAFVATDTLAVSYDGEPSFFTTKAFIVPHLRMIIAGTGVTGLMSKWFVQVAHGMVVRGIEHLNYHAPDSLNRICSYGDIILNYFFIQYGEGSASDRHDYLDMAESYR